jgi:hypothetical protein
MAKNIPSLFKHGLANEINERAGSTAAETHNAIYFYINRALI